MLHRHRIAGIAVAAALAFTVGAAAAFDDTKYPDWSGLWTRPKGLLTQWDPTKPPGAAQKPPLTPEYQAIFEASLADQAAGGQGTDTHITCVSNGMPRIMTVTFPIEFVILPAMTYIHFENAFPRRVHTDGSGFPNDQEPNLMGYSVGKWIDEDGDGRYDTLEVETRNFKGPRTYEPSGIPLHADNQTIIRERFTLDKADKDLMHNEITVIDHALTRPWTVTKNMRRDRKLQWLEEDCGENNQHVVIGKDNYLMSADGYLMPARKDQPPPDLRYFKRKADGR
jgi:hypothetical protein